MRVEGAALINKRPSHMSAHIKSQRLTALYTSQPLTSPPDVSTLIAINTASSHFSPRWPHLKNTSVVGSPHLLACKRSACESSTITWSSARRSVYPELGVLSIRIFSQPNHSTRAAPFTTVVE